LSVVLYGCETWSFILREEDRLRVFDNRVLRKIFCLRERHGVHQALPPYDASIGNNTTLTSKNDILNYTMAFRILVVWTKYERIFRPPSN
jgi:hypothetical protein